MIGIVANDKNMNTNKKNKNNTSSIPNHVGDISSEGKRKLYVVGTPIGNLEDMTFRALRILHECDVILCEDTRVTKKLLRHYEIDTPTLSYHAHSGLRKYERIFELLDEEKTLALVSDAGTPAISDPGSHLIATVREKYGNDVSIESVPGPSAVTAALSIAGVHADSFTFLGFPPHKKGRETFFKKLSDISGTVVFYESPHRIQKALNSLHTLCTKKKHVTIVRELTKMYEEVVTGTPLEVLDFFEMYPEKMKGEFVVVVS